MILRDDGGAFGAPVFRFRGNATGLKMAWLTFLFNHTNIVTRRRSRWNLISATSEIENTRGSSRPV